MQKLCRACVLEEFQTRIARMPITLYTKREEEKREDMKNQGKCIIKWRERKSKILFTCKKNGKNQKVYQNFYKQLINDKKKSTNSE